jgi:hypothetical protein
MLHTHADMILRLGKAMSSFGLSEDGMVRRMPDPLNYGSFREWCRHRLGLGTDPVLMTQLRHESPILTHCTVLA